MTSSSFFGFIGLDEFLNRALREDIGTGDITTQCCFPEDSISNGKFKTRENGIICGLSIISRAFSLLDPDVSVTSRFVDGDKISAGDVVAEITGPSLPLFSGERVAVNLLQRLSGIATATKKAVDIVDGTGAIIVDTWNTTPGMRQLEKYAVKTGGGMNHRFNLSDGVLIRSEHVLAAGGVAQAIKLVRKNAPHTLRVEVEVRTLGKVQECLEAGADVIKFVNMTFLEMEQAIRIINGRALTEAAGNMDKNQLHDIARAGVNYISISALTHPATSLGISLKFNH